MKKVIYLVENTECAQFRYRVKNVVEALEKSENWSASWLLKKDALEVDFEGVDILVILRQTAKDGKILRIIREANKNNTKVLFDLDDLIFDYRDLGLICKSVQEKSWLYWAGYVWGVRRIAKRVDGFLCTNEFLGKKLKRSFGKPVGIVPNSLNKKQVEMAEECLSGKKHNGFMIGYFSGSPTHRKDLELVEGELLQFLEMHEDVKIRIVGYMELSQRMQEMVQRGRVEILGLVDYLELMKLMSEVDVNIAPLVINDFTNCKSELKFFEAAAVETTTIASPTYAFKKAISDGEDGFLARPGEWYAKLEYLYQHPEGSQRMAKRARKYALEHYYGMEFLKEVEAVYDKFSK